MAWLEWEKEENLPAHREEEPATSFPSLPQTGLPALQRHAMRLGRQAYLRLGTACGCGRTGKAGCMAWHGHRCADERSHSLSPPHYTLSEGGRHTLTFQEEHYCLPSPACMLLHREKCAQWQQHYYFAAGRKKKKARRETAFIKRKTPRT